MLKVEASTPKEYFAEDPGRDADRGAVETTIRNHG
jgi:hypothetical protein